MKHVPLFLLLFFVTSFDQLASIQDTSGSKRADSIKVGQIVDDFYRLYSEDFENAKSMAHWALITAKENDWKKLEASAGMCLGVITYLSGDYEEALTLYLNALDLFEALSNYAGIARVNNELANFYYKQGEIEQANKCLDSAESAGRTINDLEALSTTIHHRGTFLLRQGLYLESKPFINEVYEMRIQMKDSVGLGYVLNDMAEIALSEGDLNVALDYINKSTEIRKALNDVQGVAVNYVNIGEAYLKNENHKEAIEYFEKSLVKAIDIGYTDLVRHTYQQLTHCYIKLEQFSTAFDYRERSYQLKDSLFAIEKTKHIADLQTRYETEKKEQLILTQKMALSEQKAINERNYILIGALAIALVMFVFVAYLIKNRLEKNQLLALRQKDIEYKELQLSAVIDSQEKERKRFASDLHDGFGQLISVLKLNVESIDKQDNSEKRHSIYEKSISILNEMYGEIRNICFNLMPQTLVKFGLEPSLREFAEKVNTTEKLSMKVIVFDFHQRLTDLQEISIYRIVQEWVNNILKYSSAQEVTVQLTKDEDEVTLTIEDDGNGFDLSALTKSDGNGWKNIRSRTNLIHGDLEIDSTEGLRGNILVINFPIEKEVLEATEQG